MSRFSRARASSVRGTDLSGGNSATVDISNQFTTVAKTDQTGVEESACTVIGTAPESPIVGDMGSTKFKEKDKSNSRRGRGNPHTTRLGSRQGSQIPELL